MIVLTCSLLYKKKFFVHRYAETDAVECLLKECHADPNCTNKAGQTPLSLTSFMSIGTTSKEESPTHGSDQYVSILNGLM